MNADAAVRDVKEENVEEKENEDLTFAKKVTEVVKGLPMAVILSGVVVCIGFVVFLMIKRSKKK